MVKNLPENAGDITDVNSILWWGRSSEGGNGHPLQYSCLESSMDRGAWWATVYGEAKESDMTEGLPFIHTLCGSNLQKIVIDHKHND